MTNTRLFPSFSNNRFSMSVIKDTYTGAEEISTIASDEVLNYKFSRTPLKNIKTSVYKVIKFVSFKI